MASSNWRNFWHIPSRLHTLWKRELVWQSADGLETEYEKIDFKLAWRLMGPTFGTWWWVRKFGKMSCGCTRNPLKPWSKRRVLYLWRCPNNCAGFRWDRGTEI